MKLSVNHEEGGEKWIFGRTQVPEGERIITYSDHRTKKYR